MPDHISFAIKRFNEGITIQNPFKNEIAALYPIEYDLASRMLEIINKRFNISLSEDESGFICMHKRAAVEQHEVTDALTYITILVQ